MKKQRTKVLCDACKGEDGEDAVVTCEVHMRKHFDQEACRLVPTDRELSAIEEIGRANFHEVILHAGASEDVEQHARP